MIAMTADLIASDRATFRVLSHTKNTSRRPPSPSALDLSIQELRAIIEWAKLAAASEEGHAKLVTILDAYTHLSPGI
jgi:hypothetical protein